jgi:hypothetical protein
MVRSGRPPILLSAILLALALAVAPPSAAAGTSTGTQPEVVPPDGWGWVVAREPTTATYTPLARDRGNSSGGTNTVHRLGLGQYGVTYPGINDPSEFGISLVTALTSKPRYCVVASSSALGSDATNTVYCYNAAGAPADSAFVASRLIFTHNAGHAAYVWEYAPSDADFTPAANSQFNSTGASNSIHRISTGRYTVQLGNLGSSHGNVQISTIGSVVSAAGFSVNPSACHVLGWATNNSHLDIDVACRDGAGVLADTYFFLWYSEHEGLKGPGTGPAAYLDANQKTAASYTPAAGRRWSSAAMPSHVVRSGVGRYLVSLPGMPAGGSAQVTPYGLGAAHCNISAIRASTPQKVGVRCFKPSGAPVDSEFGLSYAR